MKVLVISDTHGKIEHVKQLLEEWSKKEVTHVIHCGDYIKDGKVLREYNKSLQFTCVPGNCDFRLFGVDKDAIVEIQGVKFFITHGDYHHVKEGYEELFIDAKSLEVDIALCGHSHIPYYEQKENIVLFNPGSISYPRDGKSPSYGVVEIVNGKIKQVELFRWMGEESIMDVRFRELC
jgi:hypothetical protein